MSDGMKKLKVPLQFDGTITDRDGVTIARMNRDANSTYLTPSERDDIAKELVLRFNTIEDKDNVVLELSGYEVTGDAFLQLWGGGKGSIEMKSTYIPRENWCRKALLESINDNGHGCEAILSASVWIYKCYGVHSPHKVLSKCFEIEDNHLKPAKKGI